MNYFSGTVYSGPSNPRSRSPAKAVQAVGSNGSISGNSTNGLPRSLWHKSQPPWNGQTDVVLSEQTYSQLPVDQARFLSLLVRPTKQVSSEGVEFSVYASCPSHSGGRNVAVPMWKAEPGLRRRLDNKVVARQVELMVYDGEHPLTARDFAPEPLARYDDADQVIWDWYGSTSTFKVNGVNYPTHFLLIPLLAVRSGKDKQAVGSTQQRYARPPSRAEQPTASMRGALSAGTKVATAAPPSTPPPPPPPRPPPPPPPPAAAATASTKLHRRKPKPPGFFGNFFTDRRSSITAPAIEMSNLLSGAQQGTQGKGSQGKLHGS